MLHRANFRADSISGGEKPRVSISRFAELYDLDTLLERYAA
jgi:ABC-type phosphate/phosphonate transport system ATPase subunit